MRKYLAGIAAIAALAASATTASAAQVVWTQWNGGFTTGSTNGSATGSNGVSYSGELQDLTFGYPSWNPTTTFSGGDVSNAPVASFGAIKLEGGNSDTVDTIKFAHAVTNPVIAIWSLGQGGDTTSFNFKEPFIIEGPGGPSSEYNGGPLTSSGNVVFGTEGNGVIRFQGTFNSISWTNPTFENYYDFTVGVAAVPEPATWAMFLLGFGAIGWTLRASRKSAAVTA